MGTANDPKRTGGDCGKLERLCSSNRVAPGFQVAMLYENHDPIQLRNFILKIVLIVKC